MLKKYLAILFVLALTSLVSIASAEEESLYNRLGGTYNIASTVDYLVDMIYINNGLNANPRRLKP